MNRIIFLILGFFRFDCQNFGYFNREYFIFKFLAHQKSHLNRDISVWEHIKT